jgi:hypothetical protein
LARFTSHQRQAEGEAILLLSSVMRSLWIASAACSESNELCLSLEVVAHFIDLHAQPHFNYWLIEVVSARYSSSSTASGRTTSGLPTHPWPLRPPTGRKFYRDRGWEPLEFEEMSQTAQQMNREPGMMKFSGIIGQAFSGWDAN